MVPLLVRVVQDERPRVPDVEGAARVGGETQDDLSVHRVREGRELLRKTPKMIATFSRVFGYAYPYPKYAQTTVDDFTSST